MTEAEVLTEILEIGNQMSANIQFWISVTFGVLVAAHLTKGQVNSFVIAVSLIFYTGFTWIMGSMLLFEAEMIRSGVFTLAEMAQDGEKLSQMSEQAIKHGPLATASKTEVTARSAVLFGMYLLTCAYPIYCYCTAKHKDE